MGRFHPYLLTDWRRDHGAALVDPNRSVPIGRHRKVSSVEATSIKVDEKGTVVYGEEVKLESIQGCPLELPEEVEPLLRVRRLTGWLIYVENLKYKNHHLVVTEVPARNLYFRSQLKRACHRKKSEIVKEFRKAIEESGQRDPVRAISQGLSALSFQPFESRPRVVSAWLLEPMRIDELSITQRTRGGRIGSDETIKACLRGNFAAEKAEWSLGICEDIDRCTGFLEINEAKDCLFEQTENGNLFENYPEGNPGRPGGSGPIYRLMTAIAASFHKEVYRAAIMTAMAGIDESMYRGIPKGGTRPVINQVILLYHQFMYALVKRCDLSDPVLRNTEAMASGEISSPEEFKTLREEMEDRGEMIRSLGQEVFMSNLENTVAATEGADETLARVILAAPKEWPLSEKIVLWLRSHLARFSRAVQTMIDERLHKSETSPATFSS